MPFKPSGAARRRARSAFAATSGTLRSRSGVPGATAALQPLHAVADAHMRLDELRLRGVALDLLPKCRHEDAQARDVGVPRRAPNLVRKVRVGEHLSHVFAHEDEQFVLDGREMQLFTV